MNDDTRPPGDSAPVNRGPLAGIRVLDFTLMMAGPVCTLMLGDLGADVIKVEAPEGDPIRRTGDTRLGGETEYTLSLNRNKRGIVLDLKTAQGRADALKLAAHCDIVVENFRPGTADRLGIGYEALRAVNPRLIFCAMSGFGDDGANRDRPALDPIIQAMSGAMQLTGTPESGPLRTGIALGDFITPVFAVTGILAALHARNASGVGQRVDLSMLDAAIFSMLPREGYYFATGKQPPRTGNRHYQIAPYNSYTTADGRQIFIMAHDDKYWQAVLIALADPDIANDVRFKDNASRCRHRDAFEAILGAAFARLSAAEWTRRLTDAGAIFSLVRNFDEVFSDPDVERHMMRRVTHPTAGEVKQLAYPVRFSATPTGIRRAAPLLGEHGEEIRREFGL